MTISIITLFPQMFLGPFDHSIVKRAIDKNLISINFVDIRNFGLGKHKTVDDKTYGGGRGMILRIDVLEKAILQTKDKKLKRGEEKIILMSARGNKFSQETAVIFSKLKHLILICGHYEGVDARIENFIDEEISIGDFITTGGEIPSMLITDAVSRLIKGVLPEGVTEDESFSQKRLEYPQYTRPEVYKNLKVPETLISGHHKNITKWKKEESEKTTRKVRPDLLKN